MFRHDIHIGDTIYGRLRFTLHCFVSHPTRCCVQVTDAETGEPWDRIGTNLVDTSHESQWQFWHPDYKPSQLLEHLVELGLAVKSDTHIQVGHGTFTRYDFNPALLPPDAAQAWEAHCERAT